MQVGQLIVYLTDDQIDDAAVASVKQANPRAIVLADLLEPVAKAPRMTVQVVPHRRGPGPAAAVSPDPQEVLAKLDYNQLWGNALSGQLPVSEVCVQLSLGVFWLFLTVKVLEARRWA